MTLKQLIAASVLTLVPMGAFAGDPNRVGGGDNAAGTAQQTIAWPVPVAITDVYQDIGPWKTDT